MTELEAIRARHSVRQYLNEPLKPDELAALRAEVDACNKESGLHIQLVANEPKAFDGAMARYGKFSGVTNYFGSARRVPTYRKNAAIGENDWC